MTRKQVNLTEDTYQELKEKKRPGQSFDGIVQELIQNSDLPLKTEVKA